MGIEQLNSSMGEMDRVVQQNAANSEESASGAAEMNAQVEKLNRIVENLETMVEGHRNPKNKVDAEKPPEESYKALTYDSESQ